MELHPTFDINNQEWYVEHEGQELVADTLCELQMQLPEAAIVGYYPNGYEAIREGFLELSDRKPLITYSKTKLRKAIEGRKRSDELEQIRAEQVKAAQQSVKNGHQAPDKEAVLNLCAKGFKSYEIADLVPCRVSEVQLIKLRALRARDPRAFPQPPRKPTRPRKPYVKYPSRRWTDEDDAELRILCAQGLSGSQIGALVKRTRNAVIGRTHRIGIQLTPKLRL